MTDVQRNQVWTSRHGGRIYDVWVQDIIPSDMQTVCVVRWAYVFRPWEQHESEYFDFLHDWKLKWEVFKGLPNHKPGDEPFTHYERRDHQELHRYRMQHLPISDIDVKAQPLSDLISTMRSDLGNVRTQLSDIQSAGLWHERLATAQQGITLVISYLYGVMNEMMDVEQRQVD